MNRHLDAASMTAPQAKPRAAQTGCSGSRSLLKSIHSTVYGKYSVNQDTFLVSEQSVRFMSFLILLLSYFQPFVI